MGGSSEGTGRAINNRSKESKVLRGIIANDQAARIDKAAQWSERTDQPKFRSDLAGLVQRDDGSQPENDRGAHALQISNGPLVDQQPFRSEIVAEALPLKPHAHFKCSTG
jgi:hypothetical protein